MEALKSFFVNPFVKKRILLLPDGSSISADQYIEKYVLPKIGDADTIFLRNGKNVSVNHFINKYVFSFCQTNYNGDFDKFYNEYVVDNINDFFKKNKIDVHEISKMAEAHVYNIYNYYSIISRYIIYNDPVFTKKSISDIVGIVSEPANYDSDNIVNNLNLYFSRNTDKIINYNNRADTMLAYSSDNIMAGLYSSFNKEPIVITELENGGALISENGMHRYHLLRLLYLNELLKTNTESERNALRNKYTIPVKMETIDLFKTYSNFLLGLSGLPIYLSKKRGEGSKQVGVSVLNYNNERYVVKDEKLIEFLRSNLNRIADRSSTVIKLCECIPSFHEYISLYFPELIMEKKDDKKAFK